MNTQNKSTTEKEEISLPKSVEVDKIIEFYKDIDNDDTLQAESENPQNEAPNQKRLFFFKKKSVENSDGIEVSVYGLSERGRIYLYRSISAFISLCIIVGSFVLAYFLPGNEEIIAQQQAKLRSATDYVSIKSRHTAIKEEVDGLKTSNSEKKATIEQIEDPDNTKAALRTDIEAKKYELSELNTLKEEKRTTLEGLDASITEKAPPETVFAPGTYSVGKNLVAGKYSITGTGKFMVATSAGRSKINTTLGTMPLEVELEENDVLKFDSKVKFISIN